MNYKEFERRQYGRTELAQVYFPHLMPQSAWKKLKRWMMLNPTLRKELMGQPDACHRRDFTPQQVGLIVDLLGDP